MMHELTGATLVSQAGAPSSFLLLAVGPGAPGSVLVTTSKALVTSSDALVPSSVRLSPTWWQNTNPNN